MERKIKFRGKKCSDDQWIYGFYVESHRSWRGYKPHKSWIIPLNGAITNGGFFALMGRHAVNDNTIGQFTGLLDKNGNEIYEGDIVQAYHSTRNFPSRVGEIKFIEGSFCFCYDNIQLPLIGFYCNKLEVIGNIHDNQELIEGGAE